jgi:hypothetical protein
MSPPPMPLRRTQIPKRANAHSRAASTTAKTRKPVMAPR